MIKGLIYSRGKFESIFCGPNPKLFSLFCPQNVKIGKENQFISNLDYIDFRSD